MPNFLESHPYPGKLFIVEGIDGSGKSTQIYLLKKWLEAKGHRVFFTQWNSSELVKETTKMGKKKKNLTPTTFSLLHATDFADRHSRLIIPPLKAGMIVLADRYVFTAFTRDVVRGVHPQWVRDLYNYAVRPDISFYFQTPIETAIHRITTARARIKYYEAGMDLGLSPDIQESFKLFQTRILDEYEKLIPEFALKVVDATLDIDEQQEMVRSEVERALQGYRVKRKSYVAPKEILWPRLTVPPARSLQRKADRD